MLKEMVAQTGECGPPQTSPQHERGKLEHFGALLPWVMSKLVLIQSSIAQPWLSFQTCWCSSSIPWDGAGARPPWQVLTDRSVCLLPSGGLSEPWLKGKGTEQPARAFCRLTASKVTALNLPCMHPPSMCPGLTCLLDKLKLVKPRQVNQQEVLHKNVTSF